MSQQTPGQPNPLGSQRGRGRGRGIIMYQTLLTAQYKKPSVACATSSSSSEHPNSGPVTIPESISQPSPPTSVISQPSPPTPVISQPAQPPSDPTLFPPPQPLARTPQLTPQLPRPPSTVSQPPPTVSQPPPTISHPPQPPPILPDVTKPPPVTPSISQPLPITPSISHPAPTPSQPPTLPQQAGIQVCIICFGCQNLLQHPSPLSHTHTQVQQLLGLVLMRHFLNPIA